MMVNLLGNHIHMSHFTILDLQHFFPFYLFAKFIFEINTKLLIYLAQSFQSLFTALCCCHMIPMRGSIVPKEQNCSFQWSYLQCNIIPSGKGILRYLRALSHLHGWDDRAQYTLYFLGMTWLGKMAFTIKDLFKIEVNLPKH